MTSRIFLFLSTALTGFTLFMPVSIMAHPHIISVAEKVEVSPAALFEDLRSVQVIFMGELHDHVGHHRAQLTVIDALNSKERPLAVGLEMFRQDNQAILDLWTDNALPLSQFLPVYNDNWSMWDKYSEIFLYARDQGVKMLGLNIPREITRKVSRSGFNSLSEEERQMLGDVQCVVSPFYSDYIRLAMGGYGGHGNQFLYFCEAQLLWDSLMARTLVEFLQENPDYRVIVLAGSGHAWKFGIPRQMLESADISYRVLLPEMFKRVDRQNVTAEITDYLWLDEGEDGWTF